MTKRNYGPIFMLAAAIFWSLGGMFTKSVSWDGVSIATGRGLVAFLLIPLICRRIPTNINRIKLATAFCYFAQGTLYILANKYTTAANAVMLQYTLPLYIILFTTIATRTLPTRRDILTTVILLGGIFLAFLGTMESGGMLGNFLGLASGLFYAGVFYLSRQPGADTVDSMILGNGIYLLLLPYVLQNEVVRSAPISDLVMVMMFGLVASVIAWLCFAKGIKTTPALKASFITMIEPVMAPIWTFVLLGETITLCSLLGFVVVIVTLTIYNTRQPAEAET